MSKSEWYLRKQNNEWWNINLNRMSTTYEIGIVIKTLSRVKIKDSEWHWFKKYVLYEPQLYLSYYDIMHVSFWLLIEGANRETLILRWRLCNIPCYAHMSKIYFCVGLWKHIVFTYPIETLSSLYFYPL